MRLLDSLLCSLIRISWSDFASVYNREVETQDEWNRGKA